MDKKTLEDIVVALSKIVERLNSSEIRLRSLEEASITALKRLTVLEGEIKQLHRKGSVKLDDIEEKVETLGFKYIELAKLNQKLMIETRGTAKIAEVARLRTLVEVLR